ncbi:MAG: hypothetical protein FJ314_01530 [SAR202 cluster bacterium]|nr:hypothetical protein [SAR202 cluster bacterium]
MAQGVRRANDQGRSQAEDPAREREAGPGYPLEALPRWGRGYSIRGGSSGSNATGGHHRTTQFTSKAASDQNPAWSPDGQRIVYRYGRGGNRDIHAIDVHGANESWLTERQIPGPGARLVRSASRRSHEQSGMLLPEYGFQPPSGSRKRRWPRIPGCCAWRHHDCATRRNAQVRAPLREPGRDAERNWPGCASGRAAGACSIRRIRRKTRVSTGHTRAASRG